MRISTMDDEIFNDYLKYNREQLNQIILPPDINPVIAREVLSNLDTLYTHIRYDVAEIESAYQRAESIIRQNERTKIEGKNEEERKKNASLFLENFPVSDTETANMYDYHRLLKTRYEMVKALVNIIENKQQRLITMTGLLKIDKDIGSQYYGE